MNRTVTRTAKIPAEATGLKGALYAHLEHDLAGRVVGVSFSSPGKFADTTMETVLRALGEAATGLIEEIGRTR